MSKLEQSRDIDNLLVQAFGTTAEGLEKQAEFLNTIPEGQKFPRRLQLLGDPVELAKLTREIKAIARDRAPIPVGL